MRRGLAIAVLTLGAIWLAASPAWAHAGLVSSSPEPGTELGSAPGVVTLRFSEPLNARLSRAEVTSPDDRHFEGTAAGSGAIVVRLSTNAQGLYSVTWTTVSAVDGHTLSGSFEFGVGVSPTSEEGTTSSSPRTVDLVVAIARLLEDASLLLAVGLLLVRRLGRDLPWMRAPISWALALALIGGICVVVIEAVAAAPSLSLAALDAYLLTGLPGFARVARVGFEALAFALSIRRPALAMLPLAAGLIALAAAGHAAAANPPSLGVLLEVVHLVAAAVWTGGIMAIAIQRPPGGWFEEQGARLLARFTPIALIAFGVTAASGLGRAAQELGSLGALFGSDYGLVLLAKTFLVLAIVQLSLFAWRRIIVRPRVEAGIAIGVIGAAVLLAAFPLPPGRVEESAASEAQVGSADTGLPRPGDLTLGGHAGEVLVGLSIRPGSPGSDRLLIYLQDLVSEGSTGRRPVSVSVDGSPLQVRQCGDTCRQARANLTGGEHVAVDVGGANAGVATFTLPPLTAPSGAGILAASMLKMHSLKTYRLAETLDSGLGTVRSSYAFQAPHSYQATVAERGTTSKTIVIGDTRYLRAANRSKWTKEVGGPPLPVPSFIWDSFRPYSDVRMIGHARVDGYQTREVAFFGGTQQTTPVWFRLWIDSHGLVRRARMRAQGHFMEHRYYDFNISLTIEAPP